MSPHSKNEDEYFAKRDAELLKTTRSKEATLREQIERQKHVGKCPRCGLDLVTMKHRQVEVDICPEGHGTWVDAGEMEQLVNYQEPGLIKSAFMDVLGVIRGKKAAYKKESK
jgi:Zn-finger nucleic acid-binding protein